MAASIDRIAEFVNRTERAAFDDDWMLQNAVIRELEILGEAAGRLSSSYVTAHPEIPWAEITGLRHKLIHDYFEVDLDIVWRTATVNVPQIASFVSSAAERSDS